MKRARLPDGPRRKIDLAPFHYPPQPHYPIHECFCAYSHERLLKKGKDVARAWIGFNNFFRLGISPSMAVVDLQQFHFDDFVDARVAEGVSLGTVVRELSFIRSAIIYANRRRRILVRLEIEIPDYEFKFRRPMTEEEFRLVMSKPMSERLRRFYWLTYYTGTRSQAAEQLIWPRVDMVKLTIDFNVPGMNPVNKKRARDFPIPDEFLPRLQAWKARAVDEFVIGAGGSTYTEAAYVVRQLCGITDPSLVPRHCMRKKFASELFEREVSPDVVGKLLADDPDTLRAHYVQFKDSTLRAAVNKLRA